MRRRWRTCGPSLRRLVGRLRLGAAIHSGAVILAPSSLLAAEQETKVGPASHAALP